VALYVVYRIIQIRTFIIAFWQEDRRSQIDRLSPELCEELAPEFYALDPLGILGNLYGGNDVRADQRTSVLFGRIEFDLFYIAVEVPGRTVPLLAFPLIVVEPHGMSVSSFEFCINVDKSLDIIFTGRDVAEALDGVSECLMIENHLLIWF
jgi:hypothetical protein